MIPSWLWVPALFVGISVMDVVLAWDGGSDLALLMLAVNVLILAVCYGFWSRLSRESLDGWGRSTEGWSAAQKWGLRMDELLNEALRELGEFDEEAKVIYTGRARDASIEYMHEMSMFEDTLEFAQAIKDEIG